MRRAVPFRQMTLNPPSAQPEADLGERDAPLPTGAGALDGKGPSVSWATISEVLGGDPAADSDV